jgi:hypothetical protein
MNTDIVLNRSEKDIFNDLCVLCSSSGYVHALAYLHVRECRIGAMEEIEKNNLSYIFEDIKLMRTEFSVLHGCLIKEPIDYSVPSVSVIEKYCNESDRLLNELHQSMCGLYEATFEKIEKGEMRRERLDGPCFREPMFYSGDSAYSSQYRDFFVDKYGKDNEWFVKNKHFSISEAYQFALAVKKLLESKFRCFIENIVRNRENPDSCLSAFEFTIEELVHFTKLSSDKISTILSVFVLPDGEINNQYKSAQDYNSINSFPIIKKNETYIVFDTYSLNESLYQSPFYWMMSDLCYLETAKKNRGAFAEEFSANRLRKVFGDQHVFLNVEIFKKKGQRIGEIDVLVVFGDRIIVLQAKSKQLVVASRKGDGDSLWNDFQKAVQSACDQGYSCGNFLINEKITLKTNEGLVVPLPINIKKVYILCVISDHYPGLSFQCGEFLSFVPTKGIASPYVMDVFLLDLMTEVLDSPLCFLKYIDRRTDLNLIFLSSNEINILGYYLENDLWIKIDKDFHFVDDRWGRRLSLLMLVRRDNVVGPWTQDALLPHFPDNSLGKILKQVASGRDPAVLELGFDVLSMDETNTSILNEKIGKSVFLANESHLPVNFSILNTSKSMGFTFMCNELSDEVAIRKLKELCLMRKYYQKYNDWKGVCLDPKDGRIRFFLFLQFKWKFDKEMALLTINFK